MGDEADQIRERVGVAEIIGEYVSLKRAGAHFKALCPFHQEKTPSFIVSPEKGIWHCFGCGKGGDVFAFIQEIEGVDFREALKQLAERAGVLIRRTAFAQGKESPNKRQRLFELLALAAKFYQTVLRQHEAGKRAQKYLRERGVREETMREFQLGYAPMRWDTMQQFLQKKGFSLPEMMQAGLVGTGQSGKFYDRFRGRIMFPVADIQGRVVAFGGRITLWHATGEEGKYINSPETSLYEKRKIVYNLSRAKAALRYGEPCVVVEGYMDAMMLHQAGIKNVVASSGTALTPDHIQLLSRYTKELHFAFDADQAGDKATIAATESALNAGLRVATIVLPAGEDPADVAARGKSVEKIFRRPRSLLTVLLARLTAEARAGKREEQLAALLPLLTRVRNPVFQGELVREVAQALTIGEREVLRLLEETSVGSVPPVAEDGDEPGAGNAFIEAERQLLGVLFVSASAREAVWAGLTPELFVDGKTQALYTIMHNLAQNTVEWMALDEEALLAMVPNSSQSLARALAAVAADVLDRSPESAAGEAQALVRMLQERYLRSRLADMQARLKEVSAEEKTQALQQFQGVLEELAAVQSQAQGK